MNAKWPAILLLLFFSGYLAQSTNIYVSGDGAGFKSIQKAIDAAKEGDIVEVQSGIYKENVLVDKRLTLRGVGNPVIDAGGNGSTLRLADNGIIVEGFTLINSGKYDSGIEIQGIIADSNSTNISIQDNNISHNSEGISISSPGNIAVLKNIINNNKFSGIHLEHARRCSISENTIRSNGQGIYFIASTENIIRDNLIQGNKKEGILLASYLSEYGPYGPSDNNTLSGNDIRDNEYGIYQGYSENSTIDNNKLINNSYGIFLKTSKTNSILDNIFINNTQDISTIGGSRKDMEGDASVLVSMFYGFIFILAILLISINYIILILIGLAVGLGVKKLLKDRSLSMLASSTLGALGSIIGYFGYTQFVSDSDGVAYLIAIVFAAVLVIAASLIGRRAKRGPDQV
jgi:nitrous oxidase accessory protein